MLTFFPKLLDVLRRSKPERFYKPKSERCTHLHGTVVEAVQCSKRFACGPEIVAIKSGFVDVLNPAEQRICDFVTSYLSQTNIGSPHNAPSSGAKCGELFAKWKQVRRRTPHKNEYKCPYGKKGCGDNAIYCAQCNEDYAEFLRLTDEHG